MMFLRYVLNLLQYKLGSIIFKEFIYLPQTFNKCFKHFCLVAEKEKKQAHNEILTGYNNILFSKKHKKPQEHSFFINIILIIQYEENYR